MLLLGLVLTSGDSEQLLGAYFLSFSLAFSQIICGLGTGSLICCFNFFSFIQGHVSTDLISIDAKPLLDFNIFFSVI